MNRRFLLSTCLAMVAFAGRAAAQPAGGFPSRPVRLVVPFSPGGGSDLMARATAQKMAEVLGQQIVVENRGGANGTLGAVAVAQSRPDGYTMMLATAGELALKPLLEANLPYDPERDFDPVVMLGITPVVIAVHPSVPVRTMEEFIALAKARPGQLNMANSGSGGVMHLTAALLCIRAGIEVQHIPYRGAAPAVADAAAGTVQAVVSGLPPVLAQVREGRLRVLAVSTPRRTAAAPEVPTLDEAGITGFNMSNAVGLVVPRGTPAEIVAKLNEAANQAVQDPEVRRIFLANGAEPLGSTVEGHGAFIRSERERFREWVRTTAIRME
jgi:tripartite-type tricarboxylate transporter receptor subunit TctC